MKKILIQKIAPPLAVVLLWCIHKTLRWKRIELGEPVENWLFSEPRVVAFWHNRQLLLPFVFRYYAKKRPVKFSMLISAHSDGRLIADTVRRLGIESVAGSSSRGGAAASKELVQRLRSGHHIGITPDGPRGPIYEAKLGVVRLGQMAEAAIVPVAYAAEKKWTFKSWDRMFLPKPFSRAVVVVGQAIKVKGDSSVDEELARIQEALNEVTRIADSFDF
jgi:lysophospholipid acyltransferase (LPLAT)-like uncharacterized protein